MDSRVGWSDMLCLVCGLNQPVMVGTLLEFPEKEGADQQEYQAFVGFLRAIVAQQGLGVIQTPTEEVTVQPVPSGYPSHDYFLYPAGEGINYFLLFTTNNTAEELVKLPGAYCPDLESLPGWIVVMVSVIGGVNVGLILLDADASRMYLLTRV